MGKKKGFIDSKQSVSYQLVHRSQKDPLQADDSASKLVLKAMLPSSNLLKKGKYDLNQLPKQQYQELGGQDEIEKPSELGQDPSLYGIFFDDQKEYDYMQHLKPMGEDPSAVFVAAPSTEKPKKTISFVLPEDVLASSKENEVGLLNLAAPSDGFDPNMDPSVREALYALEDEEYVDEELQDDFFSALDADAVPIEYQEMVQQAELNKSEWEKTQSLYKSSHVHESEEEWDEVGSLNSCPHAYQKTNFSMTSSAMFRNQQLTLLDDRFDQILQEYSDSDGSDLEPSHVLSQNRIEPILEEFLDETETVGRKRIVIPKRDAFETQRENVEKVLARVTLQDQEPDEKEFVPVDEKIKLDWDVESVLSTYSNIYNRPKVLDDGIFIKLKGKNKMPVVVEEENSSEGEEEEIQKENKGIARSKKESKEEKKARKQSVKAERKDRRMVKKLTKEAFKGEELKQAKMHQSRQVNVHDLY